jgi:methionine synthase / methylenetetrahydrofolate reductase(NADPH)
MKIGSRPVVFDGAMVTYYPVVSKDPLDRCEMANIHEGGTILDIHRAYIDAGSMALRTNTFGANRATLKCDHETLRQVINEGWRLACEAARIDTEIFADIGPIPDGSFEDYKEIVDVFIEAGARRFIFETFSTLDNLTQIAEYIKNDVDDTFILISFAVSPEGYTRLGESGQKLIYESAENKNIDAAGFNCFSGPRHLLRYIQTLELGDMVFSVMPNSGYPEVLGNRTFFEDSSCYFAQEMAKIAKLGAAFIGGCCGTTPEYIRETVKIIKKTGDGDKPYAAPARIVEFKKIPNKSILKSKMDAGEKIIVVELDPPVDTDIGFFLEGAEKYYKLGVDAITIADCPVAKSRVDSCLLACKLKRELGITPIPHMTCRDRNLNAAKALLLGLNIEGINDVLIITGDPIPTAERDEIKRAHGFNAVKMANYITDLNKKIFNSPFNIYGALNVNDRNFEAQLKYAQKEVESGISVFLTQPVMTEKALENLIIAKERLDAKILGGIIPVVSYNNARFMNNEIPGIDISDDMIERYKDLSPEEAKKLAVEISTDIVKKIWPYTDGIYLITPFKKTEIIVDVLKEIR